ncbi:FAD-dependent oxidoreductase [Microlunatus soli]|uniref:2-polyprenyl-6-methoxyphenol hydroxylase n=1 Tax=Microlunatus soli TaxID=630515 RepID=A0A1H1V3K4_9ACTN|nr:FAD-dependent oxidoreductase [Microlunatus soli]SDS78956.1 2-polyprenyl-6-methoxyphenol hydroxylase [Microlunatus soli]
MVHTALRPPGGHPSTPRPTATVVGGGIAGLAAAASLARAGWTVRVLERAAAFSEVGAGLGVTNSGMNALAALGLGEQARAAGHRVRHAGYQDPGGRWLARFPDRAELASLTSFWGMHRRRLHRVLLDGTDDPRIDRLTGADVISVAPGRPGSEPAVVTWRRRSRTEAATCDLVVAADGIWSTIRSQLFPTGRPQYAGASSWRAVIEDADTDDRYIEVWGPRTSFGALRISDNETYWYGDVVQPEGTTVDDEAEAARRHFATWSPRIRALTTATSSDQLIRNDIYHLPGGLPCYISGRVVLIGDAAHAMVPNSGYGAATALEDGVQVGRLIAAPVAAGQDLGDAMTAFDRTRRPRCRRLARQGLLLARIGDAVPGGWRQIVRNTLLRRVPVAPMIRVGARFMKTEQPDVDHR